MGTGTRWGAAVAAAVVVAMSTLAGCGTTTPPAVIDRGSPTAARWAAGDSISLGWSAYFAQKPTYAAGNGGAKFVALSGVTIESTTVAALGTAYRPSVLIVNGGANDTYLPAATVIAAMAHFETTMTAMGITTTWLVEPAYPGGYATELAPLNTWVVGRPHHVDCNASVVPLGSDDGIHPNEAGYRALAACVEAAV